MNRASLDIFDLLSIDEFGYPLAPNIYQIQDKDIRELYERDKGSFGDIDGSRKLKYLKEAGVVFYLGDPKSPANQMGYSQAESIKLAVANYELPPDWQPDNLILVLAKRYKESKMGPALSAVESAQRSLHNASLACNAINELLSAKMISGLSIEDTPIIVSCVKQIGDISSNIPNLTKALSDAKQNLEHENQQQKARGGKVITSSMSTKDNDTIAQQVEAERKRLGLNKVNATPNNVSYESTK